MIVGMEKELTVYYKQIEKALDCSVQTKEKILLSLKSDVADFMEQHPNATFSAVIEHFGEPVLFAGEYVASLDKEIVHKQISKSRTIKRSFIIAAAGILLIGTIIGIVIAVENSKTAGVYYFEEVSDTTQVEG